MNPVNRVATAGIALFSAVLWRAEAVAQDTWGPPLNAPAPAEGQGGGAVNGIIYVFGGAAPGITVNTWAYDPLTNEWTPRAPMPQAVAYMGSVTIDNLIYSVGGAGVDYADVGNLYVFDPKAGAGLGQWTELDPMPTPRSLLASCAVANGRIYACGGGYGNPQKTVEEYNPESGDWSPKTDLPCSLFGAYAGGINGKVYVAAGWGLFAEIPPGAESDISRRTYEYDPGANEWTRKADMPDGVEFGIYCGASTAIGGSLYTFGGTVLNPGGGEYTGTYEYRALNDIWFVRAAPPHLTEMALAVACNEKAYVFGNHIDQPDETADYVQEYTPILPPTRPLNLRQLDGTGADIDPLNEYGGTVAGAVIRFRADVDDPGGKAVKLEVEAVLMDASFTGASHPDLVNPFGPGGTLTAELPTAGLLGAYRWRARGVNSDGMASEWVRFSLPGMDPDVDAAFSVGITLGISGSLSVDEAGGVATITVQRMGFSAGEVSVAFGDAGGGTATPGADYAIVGDTLTWAGGDVAPKTFIVTITPDTLPEGSETVRLLLSNPTGGAVIAGTGLATLTIDDDDNDGSHGRSSAGCQGSGPAGAGAWLLFLALSVICIGSLQSGDCSWANPR